jgi:hypothetical protein
METMEQSSFCAEASSKNILGNYKAHRFEIPDQNFFLNISKSEKWFPEELTPWYYLPQYHLLPEEVQMRYNQLYALGTNEVFAIFEVEFISKILKTMQTQIVGNSLLQTSLQNFCEEEEKHAEMFHLLNQAACPEYYSSQSKYFLANTAHPAGILLLTMIKKFPRVFGAWVWIALFFEERSLVYSKFYLKSENAHLNRHFREIHKLHMIEEASHVQLDEVFVNQFYRPLAGWKKKVTGWMLRSIVQSHRTPKRMSRSIAKVLRNEFPDSHAQIQECLNQLPGLAQNREFQEISLGLKATARTRRLMRQFPEFSASLKLLRD